MKRFIFLVIASIVTGKFVGAYLNNFADTHAPKIHKRLANDRPLDEGLRMGVVPDHFDGPNEGAFRAQLPIAPYKAPAPGLMPPAPIIAKAAAKPSPSPADDAKKKKKEEEDAAKKLAAMQKPVAPTMYNQPLVPQYAPQPYGNNYGQISSGGVITTPAATAGAAPTTTNTATNTKTTSGAATSSNTNLSSWITELVDQPNASEMQQFVALYSAGKVTQAQFYTVMNAMEKSTVVESRTLLVQTLNGIKNTESFQILSDVSATDGDATTRAQALQAVDSYNSVSYLSILSTALSSSDVNEAINAAANVQVAAQNSQQNMTTATQSLFKPFVQLLQPLTQSTNASLRQYASSALSSVEAIVGTSVAGN